MCNKKSASKKNCASCETHYSDRDEALWRYKLKALSEQKIKKKNTPIVMGSVLLAPGKIFFGILKTTQNVFSYRVNRSRLRQLHNLHT